VITDEADESLTKWECLRKKVQIKLRKADMEIKLFRINQLSDAEKEKLMQRSMQDVASIYDYVREIIYDVRDRKDKSLVESLKEIKKGISEEELLVSEEEIKQAYEKVDKKLVDYLRIASENIKKFHSGQLEKELWAIKVSEGIIAGRLARPIEKAGCYVPGGIASYPSSVLMCTIPAKVAGVKEVFIATPPQKGMNINPLVLVAADLVGINRIFKIGGPWAIAAFAVGTNVIPKVDKIVGPGNKYVTAAKMIVYSLGMVDIDMPAGPSEALIIADESANPEWLAVDFLSQIEHDPDSSAILISTSEKIAQEVAQIISAKYEQLPRKEIYESSLSKYSYILIAKDIEEAVEFANEYAPEHLQIVTKEPFLVLQKIKHAGSIFLGAYAPVPVGDYASGTNHVLPTGKGAKMFSGLSVDDFIKKPTFQYITKDGLENLKDVVVGLAKEEGLPMHAEAVKVRFDGCDCIKKA